MTRDAASREVPTLRRPDGRRAGLLIDGPPILRRPWRRAVTRLRSGRLPALVASFADDRRFAIEAGDVMYEQVVRLGEYEPAVTNLVRALLREGDRVADVGANHGWYSLVMARAVGSTGHVDAFEPVPPLAAALRRNLELNPHLQVDVHDLALGASDGTLELHLFPDLPHGHASAATLGRRDYDTFSVPLRRLDDVLAEPPVLVKVDVEGYEPEVVAGSTRLVAGERPPMWLIEVNVETASAFGRRPAAALEPLAGRGYEVYRVEPGGLEREPDPGSAPHGTTWLCVPEVLRDRVPGHG